MVEKAGAESEELAPLQAMGTKPYREEKSRTISHSQQDRGGGVCPRNQEPKLRQGS